MRTLRIKSWATAIASVWKSYIPLNHFKSANVTLTDSGIELMRWMPPIDLWEAAEQRPRADVVADLPCGDEQVERSPLAVTDGM